MLATLFLLAQILITPSSNNVKLQGPTTNTQNGSVDVTGNSTTQGAAIFSGKGSGSYLWPPYAADGIDAYSNGYAAAGVNGVNDSPAGQYGLGVYGQGTYWGGFFYGGLADGGSYWSDGGVVSANGLGGAGSGYGYGLYFNGGQLGGNGIFSFAGPYSGGSDEVYGAFGNGIEALGDYGGPWDHTPQVHGYGGVFYSSGDAGSSYAVGAFGSAGGGLWAEGRGWHEGILSTGGIDGGVGGIFYGGGWSGIAQGGVGVTAVGAGGVLYGNSYPADGTSPFPDGIDGFGGQNQYSFGNGVGGYGANGLLTPDGGAVIFYAGTGIYGQGGGGAAVGPYIEGSGGTFLAGGTWPDDDGRFGGIGITAFGTGRGDGFFAIGGPRGRGAHIYGACQGDPLNCGSLPDGGLYTGPFYGDGISADGFGGSGYWGVLARGNAPWDAGTGDDGLTGGLLATGAPGGGIGMEGVGGNDGGTGVVAVGGSFKGYGEVIQAANPVNAELQLVPTAAPTVKTIPGDIYMDSTEKSLAYSGGAQGYRFIPRCFPVLFSASGTATATVETGSSLCIATDSVHSYSVSCGISGTTLTLTASVPNSDPWAVCYW